MQTLVTSEAQTIERSDPVLDAGIAQAIRHLRAVTAGDDVPANLQAATKLVIQVFNARGEERISAASIEGIVEACLAAIGPAREHFRDYMLPSTIDFGIKSVASLARTVGYTAEALGAPTHEIFAPAWFDGANILLAETTAAVLWRRVRAREQIHQIEGAPGRLIMQ